MLMTSSKRSCDSKSFFGHTVRCFQWSNHCIEHIRAHKTIIVSMPFFSFEVLKGLLSLKKTEPVPYVYLSGTEEIRIFQYPTFAE